jgi:hypothetical protein
MVIVDWRVPATTNISVGDVTGMSELPRSQTIPAPVVVYAGTANNVSGTSRRTPDLTSTGCCTSPGCGPESSRSPWRNTGRPAGRGRTSRDARPAQRVAGPAQMRPISISREGSYDHSIKTLGPAPAVRCPAHRGNGGAVRRARGPQARPGHRFASDAVSQESGRTQT